jgi:NADH-quinone oxidoreductase subunit E
MVSFDRSAIDTLIEKFNKGKSSLIAILQDIQSACGYLPKEALEYLSTVAGIPLSKIYCITTFYSSFSLKPRGKNLINVCLGTACHVKNGENLLERLGRELKLDDCIGTTADLAFTVEKVHCMGCCSMAPALRINEDTYGDVTQSIIPNLLQKYRKDM